MLVLGADQVRILAPLPRLIDALQEAFCKEYVAPARQVMKIPGGAGERLLLFMPAFDANGSGAVKISTVCPDNQGSGAPTIQASILVFSPTGTPVALLDGTLITRLRTGAASALASRYLSRIDSSHLVVIGTGALAPMMAAAHCTVRPITRVTVCGRRSERAGATAVTIRSLIADHVEVIVGESIDRAVASADIVSCATSSSTALISGRWLRPGTFVDLVGSFSPSKRETDDDVVLRSRIFVDTFEGALTEAGDILDPIRRGIIERRNIEGELADLVRGRATGRRTADEITLFKSVGTAIEDFATSRLVVAAALDQALMDRHAQPSA
jgi:alanine dehydrogenase